MEWNQLRPVGPAPSVSTRLLKSRDIAGNPPMQLVPKSNSVRVSPPLAGLIGTPPCARKMSHPCGSLVVWLCQIGSVALPQDWQEQVSMAMIPIKPEFEELDICV